MEIGLGKFEIDDQEDLGKRWSRWHKKLERYFEIKEITDERLKITHLFFFGGDDLEDKYEMDANANDNYANIIAKLTAIFVPVNTEQMHDHQFSFLSQFDHELFDEYVTNPKSESMRDW